MIPIVSCHRAAPVHEFRLLLSEADRYATPQELPDLSQHETIRVPTTLAAVLSQRGELDLARPSDFDAQDCWFVGHLPDPLPSDAHTLSFEGLATICDVWLDGQQVLHSENMYRHHQVQLSEALTPGAQLALCFRALNKQLSQRRGRPRHRTRIVDQQQLRWIRTSLLGRTPGFSPRLPVVGPYRPVAAISEHGVRVLRSRVHTALHDGRGQLRVHVLLALQTHSDVRATLQLRGEAGEASAPLNVTHDGDVFTFSADVGVDNVKAWWPHTHGAQPRSHLTLQLSYEGRDVQLDLGRVGFRSIHVERGADGQGFELRFNGQPLFCRGACWTTTDLLSMSESGLHDTLRLVVDAGMNMLRITGTTAYESDAFYDACDQLGILLFHDFMFANMDYPGTDTAFMSEVQAELETQLTRLSGRPSVAVLCGGSEVEQQVSMLGLGPELVSNELFQQLIPKLCQDHCPGIPYVSNSPSGGHLPFSVDAGITHYYGVGAYLRPFSDVRQSRVRFAAECLAFANMPSTRAMDTLLRDLEMPFHHPRWKERVPRDRGVGWDFEDVRDHYLEQLYRVSARQLRYEQPDRYVLLSRAVVVDVMEHVLSELRTSADCGGALVYWLKDLWLAPAWGVIDARNEPKSAYYALKRSFAPLALLCTDEGMNGPALHVLNDGEHEQALRVHVALYRDGQTLVSEAQHELTAAPRSHHSFRVEALFPRFLDVGYLYRFGPPSHDVLVATLKNGQDQSMARTYVLPLGPSNARKELGLTAQFQSRGDDLGVLVKTTSFAERVELEVDGYVALDNYFHLAPGASYWVALRPFGDRKGKPSGRVNAVNALTSANIGNSAP